MSHSQSVIDSVQILQLLPHRYPFLLVDRVLDYSPGEYIKAVKNVTINEPFFEGHFPGYPVMPGVLIVEALAQAGGILIVKSSPDIPAGKIFLFSGIEKMRFRKPVYPGDQIELIAEKLRHKMNMWKMQVEARVAEHIAAQGILSAAVVDKEEGAE
jgi:3-hydroxyacyl-[acyl-carrier-protein] dehydratase